MPGAATTDRFQLLLEADKDLEKTQSPGKNEDTGLSSGAARNTKMVNGAPVVVSAAGAEIALPSLWLSRRCVLVFLRHFGCRFCKQHTQLVRALKAEYEKERAKENLEKEKEEERVSFVLVGIGDASHIEEFSRQMNWDGELYVVPDVKETANQGAPFGEFRLPSASDRVRDQRVLGPNGTGALALAEGFEDGGFPHKDGGYRSGADGAWVAHPEWAGNAHQLGGVFIVGPGNVCSYSFRSEYAGHFPEAREILKLIAPEQDTQLVAEATKHWAEKLKISCPAQSVQKGRGGAGCPIMEALGRKKISAETSTAVSTPYDALTACALSVALIGLTSGKGRSWSLGLVGGTLAAVALQFAKLRNSRAAEESHSSRLRLLTPLEVDAEMMRRPGGIACDCGFVDRIEMQKARKATEASLASSEVGSVPKDEDLEVLATMLCYVREFLAKTHPSVGRGGPVCPFIPKTLKTNCLYVGVLRVQEKSEVEREVMAARRIFKSLEPAQGNMKFFRAIVLVFPEISLHTAHEVIDETQNRLKDTFVEEGLMLGEFHLLNNSAGLRNEEFFPLRTPYPCLAIRHMVPSDLPFLKTKKAWTESYLKQFDSAENFAKAKEELRREAELALCD